MMYMYKGGWGWGWGRRVKIMEAIVEEIISVLMKRFYSYVIE